MRGVVAMSELPALYDIEAGAEFSAEINGSDIHTRIEDAEATLRVDDISHGLVALATFADTEATGVETLTRLYPEEAQRLGVALIQAADYAKRQDGDSDA